MKNTAGARIVAERYARALLAVLLEQNAEPDTVDSELSGFEQLLSKEKPLESVLSSPAIASEKRVAVLEGVLSKEKLSPYTMNLLRLLTRRERMPLLGDVADSFRTLLLEHRKVQSGHVVSATDLSGDQKQRLAESLGRALGKTLRLDYSIDPTMIGGLVVRIGNRIFDASVTSQLRRIKERALRAPM